jgi:16S rRNA (adenine1518-N6/adenine1519-N6)-dimethyltransferase
VAQTLAEIKALLAANGLRPRHRFGQNFLHDAAKMEAIIAAAQMTPGELVLEVGPGTGALTERLLEEGARVVGVEIDRDLAAILGERLAGYGDRFRLMVCDVLTSKHCINPQVTAALEETGTQAAGRRFKLVANLPYNVASPLIANLVLDYPAMELAIVMVQREVAQRLWAEPGGKDYGPLGVLVQALCEVERIAMLSPACFWPQPKIDSAVVRLRRRATSLTADAHALSALLQRVFGQRRKQLGTILGRGTPLPPGIDATARPEQLTVEQLIALADALG